MSTNRRWVLGVEGMTCDGCARGLDAALSDLVGVLEANTSFPEARSVVLGTSDLDRSALAAVVAKKGYELKSADSEEVMRAESESRSDWAACRRSSAWVMSELALVFWATRSLMRSSLN